MKIQQMIIKQFRYQHVPSGKHLHNYYNYGKSSFLIAKSSISMAIFNSKVLEITRGYQPSAPLIPVASAPWRWKPPAILRH
jgi:hypothetical protein